MFLVLTYSFISLLLYILLSGYWVLQSTATLPHRFQPHGAHAARGNFSWSGFNASIADLRRSVSIFEGEAAHPIRNWSSHFSACLCGKQGTLGFGSDFSEISQRSSSFLPNYHYFFYPDHPHILNTLTCNKIDPLFGTPAEENDDDGITWQKNRLRIAHKRVELKIAIKKACTSCGKKLFVDIRQHNVGIYLSFKSPTRGKSEVVWKRTGLQCFWFFWICSRSFVFFSENHFHS